MPRYKVAFIISSLNRGGMETRLVDMLKGLDRTRFDPFLFVAKDGGDLLADVADQRVYIGSKAGSNVLRSLPALWRALRRERPDVVWCLQSNALSAAGRLFAHPLRTRAIVLSLHGFNEDRLAMGWPARLLTRLTTDRVVALSQTYRRWLVASGLPEALITVQYNGVDTERFRPAEDRDIRKRELLSIEPLRPVIGTVGGLRLKKAHEVFVRAARQVIESRPDALFVIVGDGPRRAMLERMREELGLADQLWFLGKRTDVPDLMRAFDLFCLTSDNGEGCSNVTLEAMATGLPVITTSFGGASELVDEMVGVMVPVQDDAALAGAILQLLDDPAQRQVLGHVGRQRAVERFSLETMIQAREKLLLELLGERI
jgi:glycosyltransferase involved in cell wall biosynthesis